MIRTILLSVAATLTLPAASVFACGGFFCNNATPVDQTGENIVFAMEANGTVTAHVQISYEGPANEFAWILPAPTLPELGVGTDTLFSGLQSATSPRFTQDFRTDGSCATEPECIFPDRPDFNESPRFDAGAGFADSSAQPPTVEVLLQENVGPYNAVVLSSSDAAELLNWLQDNGYDIPDASRPTIAEYIEMNMVFVALKLQKGEDAGDIVPLTMNFTADAPMIPLKLTGIAAMDNMPITAWILGSDRVKSSNFPSVDFDYNQASLWTQGNYASLADASVDPFDGKAFITEFAGNTPDVQLNIQDLTELASDNNDPTEFLNELRNRGLNGDPGLLPALLRVLPPPADVESRDFYNCIAQNCGLYSDYLNALEFDSTAAATDLDEAIMKPRREAKALLDRHSQLTRLFTTMDAVEMDADPMFVADSELPEVNNVHTAVRVTKCDSRYYEGRAPRALELPNGTEVSLTEGEIFTPYQYCENRGGMAMEAGPNPPSGEGVPPFPEERVVPTSGCSATAGAGSAFGSGILLLAGLLFQRRRKRS